MGTKKLLSALVVVVLIIIIAWVAWHHWNIRGTIVQTAFDGEIVALMCKAGQVAKIVSARYAPKHGKAVDVTERLRVIFNSLSGLSYTVNARALGQSAGGKLTFRYRCVISARAGFRPVPITTCGTPYDDHYAVDMTSRNAAGTVVWDPYSTQSRVSLSRFAETPEVAESAATRLNPVSGIGKTASVRAMSDRYRGADALRSLSEYELQPGEPGYMEEVGDGTMTLMAQVARRPTSVAAGMPTCLLAGADIDSDFFTDGYYDEAVLKEALTSRRQTQPNTLTGSKVGLGSIRQDPRFEPGPQTRTPDGDASWSHGANAGGPTTGGFGSSRFFPMAGWDWNYVHGFGDVYRDFGRQYPVEAMVTEHSLWNS